MARGARSNTLSVSTIHAPIKLSQAKKKIEGFCLCSPDGKAVSQVYKTADGKEYMRGELRSAVKVAPNRLAIVPQEALDALNSQLQGIEVLKFVRKAHVPTERVIDQHYVEPAPGSARVLALLHKGMTRSKTAAAIKYRVGAVERLGFLEPRGDAFMVMQLAFREDFHEPDEEQRLPGLMARDVPGVELKMVLDLIKALMDDDGAIFDEAIDESRIRRNKIIADALDGTLPAVETDSPAVVEEQSIPDLMAALEESLAEATKKSRGRVAA